MGRITSYDQNGRMVADFDKSGYDLMWMRQGYDDEIERLTAENAKLRELIVRCCDCESAREHYEGMDVWWCGFLAMYVGSSDFCCWGKKREDA